MMVYCPKCGTANRRGSRFCNECGEPLPLRTALRCPMCGTMNPVTNVHCDQCQARLIPMAAPRAEDADRAETPVTEPLLPTIPTEGERERQVEGVAREVEPEEVEAEDWLAQLRASAAEEAEEPETVDEPIEAVEIPDWLREMGPIGAEAETTPSEEPPYTEALLEKETPTTPSPAVEEAILPPTPVPAETLDWLREIAEPEAALPTAEAVLEETGPDTAPPAAEATLEEAVPTPPPVPAEIPDWLREMAPPEAVEPEPPVAEVTSALPPPAAIEIPDWLQEVAPSEAAEPEAPLAEVTSALPPPAAIEIPDWLREMAPPEAVEPEPPLAEVTSALPAPAAVESPDRLREMAPPETPTEAPPEAPPSIWPPIEFPAEAEAREAPDWLAELEAQPTPPPTPTAAAFEGVAPSPLLELEIGAAEAEELARAEIPDWLEALRPEAAAEREPVETAGPLEGLRGVLTPTSAIKMPALPASAPPSEISEVSLTRAQLLQGLLTRPVEVPRPEVRARGIRMSERVQRWLVMATLLIAVGSILVAPLVVPRGGIPTLARPAESPAADRRMEFQRLMRMHDVVQGVHAGDAVLVAFEYGPPEADELNLVAEPVLEHLLDQGAHVSVVSTRPEGQAVAAGLLNDIVASEERYAGQYTLLHYRAGDVAGVSQLLIDTEARPGLIVVLTAQPGPLRWWVEQTRALYGDALPVIAGISAALEPAASPYLDLSARQLEGAINGLNGAAAYEALRGSAGQATQRLNALAVGHAAIVGLMVLGAVFYTLGGLRGRER